MSTSSLLQTALQNLHVSQMARDPSLTPAPSPRRHPRALSEASGGSSPPDSSDGDGDDGSLDGEEVGGEKMISVGKGTRPGTPIAGKGMVLGQRISKVKDPVCFLSWDKGKL